MKVWRCRSADVRVWRCRSADVKVWRCRSADVRVWTCRSAGVRAWRCRSAAVRVWRCRSAGVRVWRCRSADVRVWRCRSAGVRVWRCRSADVRVRRRRSAGVRVWRCRSADVKVWRCRSADVKVWRCRSADVRVWRCRSADVKVWRCRSANVKVRSCIWRLLFYEEPFAGALGKKTSYKITPCDEHSTSIKKTSSLVKTHFFSTQPPLMAPRLPSTRCAALLQWATGGWVLSPRHPRQPGREAHLLIFPTEHYGATQHLVKQLLHEILPIWQPIQLPDHPPTAFNTVPPQKKKTPILQHRTMRRTLNFNKKKQVVWLKPIF